MYFTLRKEISSCSIGTNFIIKETAYLVFAWNCSCSFCASRKKTVDFSVFSILTFLQMNYFGRGMSEDKLNSG